MLKGKNQCLSSTISIKGCWAGEQRSMESFMLNYCTKAISWRIIMTIYSPLSLLPRPSASVTHFYPSTSTCVKTPNNLTHMQLIVEEWLHKMCKKDLLYRNRLAWHDSVQLSNDHLQVQYYHIILSRCQQLYPVINYSAPEEAVSGFIERNCCFWHCKVYSDPNETTKSTGLIRSHQNILLEQSTSYLIA